MANFKQNFWIDTERKTLVKGFNTTSTVANPKFIQGDTVELNVILLKPTGQNGQPYSVVPITDQALKVGLGLVDTAPTSGNFTLTFDGDTTTALNFDDDATTVQTALNALASITTAGGVTVTGDAPGPLTVKFNSTGAQNYITATTTDIIPTSYLANIRKQTGDGSTREIQVLKIRQSLVALQTSFTTISAPQITITEQIAGGAGVNEFQTLEIDQECEGGSFSVTFGGETAIVTYQSSAVDFQANLEALSSIGVGNITVEKVSDILYNIYFTGTLGGANQALMTADATGLKGFSGFTGTLSLGSYSVDEFLNGSDSKSCVLEVELNQTGNKSTVLKIGATIENDSIDDAQSSPPQTGINWEALIDAKADKVNVLELDNTTLFIPSEDYHPATKKYIDDINTSIQSSLSAILSDLDTAETNIANLQSDVIDISPKIGDVIYTFSTPSSDYLPCKGGIKLQSSESALYTVIGLKGNNKILKFSTRTSSADNQWLSVCWSPELSLFCAVSITGTGNRVMTSPDGVTWTSRTSAVDNQWFSVCWSPELSLFCAVSNTGTGDRVMTSPDGTTWTSRTSASDNDWVSVCWSPELTLFCAVASTGTGNRVMTSPDGSTWTSRTSSADNDWRSVCWSPELTLFCAVSITGTGTRVMTSPDGSTWTARTSAADNSWYGVCWSPELSMFCAVSSNGTNNQIMSSKNGINWTSRSTPANNTWRSICWSPELSIFLAVSSSGTGTRVMTSTNGFNWSVHNNSIDNGWYSVCWSPENMIFASVSNTGTGDRVMTSSFNFDTATEFALPMLEDIGGAKAYIRRI